jgi:hypothetical protein
MAHYRKVRAALESTALDPNLSLHLEYNDALEPVLEIAWRDGAFGAAWLFGMMDEPVWGYDLEVDDGEDRSWSHVKEQSLELPEMSEPTIVAAAILIAVDADRAMIVAGRAEQRAADAEYLPK